MLALIKREKEKKCERRKFDKSLEKAKHPVAKFTRFEPNPGYRFGDMQQICLPVIIR